MAIIDNRLAKPNIVLFKIVSLAAVAACTITCFVVPSARSNVETRAVKNCPPVEICWSIIGPNSEERCFINTTDHSEYLKVNTSQINVTAIEKGFKCKCNRTVGATLQWNASERLHLPAKIMAVATTPDIRISILITELDPAKENYTKKHLCSAIGEGVETSIQLDVFEDSATGNIDDDHSNSTTLPDDSWFHCIEEKLEIYILRLITIVAFLLFLYISLRRLCGRRKKRKTSYRDKAVVIPLERNMLPNTKCITNPTFTDSCHAGSTFPNPSSPILSFTNPSNTNFCFTNPRVTNLSFTNSNFTSNSLPKPRKSMVPIISRSAITQLQKIGEGFFGEVYKAQLQVNINTTTETVAIKMLKKPASLEAEKDFMKEVEIMSSFKHPNIVSLVGLCFCETLLTPWMIFEYMSQGDLVVVLRKMKPQSCTINSTLALLPQESLVTIALHISKGMEYLARQRYVHRDLACRNCLVGENLMVKIADFGMSRDVHERDYYKVNENKVLPIRWMAPESIQFGTFTLTSDVWSFGVVLWEIYNYGKRPYYGHCNEEVLRLVLDGHLLNIPNNCPAVVANIMRACWKKYIEDRITFTEICEQLSHLKDSINYQNIAVPQRPPSSPIHSARSAGRNAYKENDMDNLLNEYSDYLTPILKNENVSDVKKEFRRTERFLVNKNRLFSGPSDKALKRYDNPLGSFSTWQNLKNGIVSTRF